MCGHTINHEAQHPRTLAWIEEGVHEVLGGGRCVVCSLDGVTIFDPERITKEEVLRTRIVAPGHPYKRLDFSLAG